MSDKRRLIAGRYRLRQLVGSGGMGRVWLARDEVLHRDVAIKEIVPPEWLAPGEREELRNRMLREARTAAQLNHPHVVKIYDVVHSEEWPWIVMEYIPSRSLQQVIREDGPLPAAGAARIGLALLDALCAAHGAGVLHRDVKPHNVLVGEDGRVVLTDFGLATLDSDGAITHPDVVMGSPWYIAPERARLGISNAQTDLWSLGATLYAAVEGHSPYARSTSMATLTALATEPPDPMQRAGPLRGVLEGLLRKNPRERIGPAETERMLRRVAAGETVAAPRRQTRLPRRRLLGSAGVALVLIVTAVAVTAALSQAEPAPPGAGGGPANTAAPATEPPAAELPYLLRCDRPPPTASPVPTGAAGPPGSGTVGLAPMPDWSWYHDEAAGFSIAVPPGWSYFTAAGTVCFLDPFRFRVLGVDPDRTRTDNPVEAATAEAQQMIDAGHLPGYDLVSLKPRAFAAAGAEWEFTFEGPSGRRHAVSYFVTSPGRSYAVFWVTAEAEWQPSLAFAFSAMSTFRPA